MKQFIYRIGVFFLIVFVIILIGICSFYKIIDEGNHYKIGIGKENLILGHSHTMCAFNDTIIKKALNLSDNGENYFYILVKLNKLIKNNNNIKNVFLSFTNNQIGHSYDSTTIWSKKYISYRYPKYAANLSFSDFYVLCKNNPVDVLKNQQKAVRNNFNLVFNDDKKIVQNGYWGSFNYSKKSETDSLINNYKSWVPLNEFRYSKITLEYLDKIITLCKENKVNLYLVRSPIHTCSEELKNEYFFIKLLNREYVDVEFLDFKDFPLKNSHYRDFEHLNCKGATEFSLFFESLLKNDILNKKNKQVYINNEMKKIAFSREVSSKKHQVRDFKL